MLAFIMSHALHQSAALRLLIQLEASSQSSLGVYDVYVCWCMHDLTQRQADRTPEGQLFLSLPLGAEHTVQLSAVRLGRK